MFARIAPRYDLMNRLMSAGLDIRWRRLAAAAADVSLGGAALDVCCGTGDLTFELAQRVGSTGMATGHRRYEEGRGEGMIKEPAVQVDFTHVAFRQGIVHEPDI